MVYSIILICIFWVWVVRSFIVRSEMIYLRNGEVVDVKEVGRLRWVTLACTIYITGDFIYKHVMPLI